MRALVIGGAERVAIADLIARAKERVVPLATVVAITNTGGNDGLVELEPYRDLCIPIPVGFEVAYTHEEQKQGVCRHLSVRTTDTSKGPGVAVVCTLMELFGFKNSLIDAVVWKDDHWRDGGFAINVVEPLDGDVAKLRKGPDDKTH